MHRFEVRDGFSITFVQVETPLHFAYYKPDFLDRVLTEFDPNADAAIYLDPDIIVKCPWHLIERWPSEGIALVEDVHSAMPQRHPMRLAWREILSHHGVSANHPCDRYYNSGFVGVPRSLQGFLATWSKAMAIVISVIGEGKGIKHGASSDVFHTTDQDALNLALMISGAPVNAAGSDAMDFATGGYLLSHAIGTPKPWRGGFLREALRGFPPTTASKAFLRNSDAPIRLFEPARRASLALALALGAAIGRFYRRA
ncbi:MAG: hypothetical protein PHC88_07870 [Terrimicrobiaceae bacterium]|nr:hypothetical protein [Terrimicrobiaceae bacterium]